MSASSPKRIAIVADFNGGKSHLASEESLHRAARELDTAIEVTWIGTGKVGDPKNSLARFDAIWAGPCSPYESMEGALSAIRFARENKIPLIGTCGGFQHSVIEFARNALGYADADHEETAPDAKTHFISRLACSLHGREMTLCFEPESHLGRAYQVQSSREEYICNFGVNPEFVLVLQKNLRIAAWDAEGQIRAIEIPDHPFFVATLFLPQHWAFQNKTNPLISAFVRAA